jgi:transposase
MNTTQDQTVRKQERFITLRAEGDSYRTIAKKLRISRQTLTKWEGELSERISEAKRDRLETVYKEYGMFKESRIRSLGERLKRIESELDKRDLSDVSSDKLLDLALKYRATLREEYSPLNVGGQGSLSESIKETVEILTTRIKSGELETNSLKTETASLLSLVKAKESLPPEDTQEELRIRFHCYDDVDKRLDEIKAQAQLMTTPEKDSVLSMIQELTAMKEFLDDHNPEKDIITVTLPRGGAQQ